MIKFKVRERRELGTNPYPNIVYFTSEEELLVTQTVAKIVKEDHIKLLAFNICADHIHLLLFCGIDEIPRIMQKIKGRTSFVLNKSNSKGFNKGFKPLAFKPLAEKKEKKKPIWQQKYSSPKEITSQNQLENTIRYIQTNRNKHQLPPHKENLQNIIDDMCSSF